jgi:hypothetical protein
MIQAGGHRLAEVVEWHWTWEPHAVIGFREVVVRAADADRPQPRLDRAKLADERLRSLVEGDAGDQDIDVHSAHDFERFERVLGAQDPMAGLTQGLVNQLLYGRVFLEDEDGPGDRERHAATLPADERRRQTQMGQSKPLPACTF